MLKKRGAVNIRPLAGGFKAWRELNYPVEPGRGSLLGKEVIGEIK
jgi:rhodanese-related sulfurtransferase